MVDDAAAPGRDRGEEVELDRGEGERPTGNVGPAATDIDDQPVGKA